MATSTVAEEPFTSRVFPSSILIDAPSPSPLLIAFSLGAGLLALLLLSSDPPSRRGQGNKAFRFLDLPPELREQVYEYLADDSPSYPPAPAKSKSPRFVTALLYPAALYLLFFPRALAIPLAAVCGRVLRGLRQLHQAYVDRRHGPASAAQAPRDFPSNSGHAGPDHQSTSSSPSPSSSSSSSSSPPLPSTHLQNLYKTTLRLISRRLLRRRQPNSSAILLTSRRVHREYLAVLCKHATFQLHIRSGNQTSTPLWPLGPAAAAQLRHADVLIEATPGMIDAFDPRVAPADWLLRDRAHAELAAMARLRRLSLRVHARGSQIWNPIWLWHYTSQSFKALRLPNAPWRVITFHLSGWSPGENHLRFNAADKAWEWRCPNGHFVCRDPPGTIPIRDFCAALYDECEDCPARGT